MRYFKCFFIKLLLIGGLSSSVFAQIPTDSLQLHLSASLGITSSGDSVNTWADQSGKGNNAFQNTLARRPILVSNSMNGEPVIKFNGVNSYLTLPTASDLGIQNSDYEIFIVSRSASVNTDVEFLIAGNTEKYELHLNGSAGARFIPKTSTFIDEGAIGDYSDTNAHIYNVRATDTYGNVTVDAVNSTNSAVNARSSDAGNLYLGVRFDNSFALNGDIAEVLIYNTVLSPLDRGAIENYLGNKYGVDVPVKSPSIQASNLTASEVTGTSLKLNVNAGNGSNRIIIAKEGEAVDAFPVDGQSYAANSVFESGSELGSGNFVVYNGSADSVNVTGLSPFTTYHFYAIEYNGESGEEKYLSTNPATSNKETLIQSNNLQLYLKADAGVNLSGSNVTSWSDQSGQGNNATQTFSTNRPAYVENSMNGEPALRFDGTNDFMSLSTATDLGIVDNDYQIFIIAKTSAATNSVYFLTSAQSASEQYEIHTNGSQGVRFIPEAGFYIDEGTTGEYTDGKPHLYQIEATSTYGLIRMDGDGTAQSSGDRRSSEASSLLLGTRNGGSLWFNGDIAEVIIYNSVLSESDRHLVESYLKEKYNYDPPTLTPTVQASNVTVSEVESTSMKVSMTTGDGEQRIVVAKSGGSVDALPVDATNYTANSAFGSGTDLGSGNYIVYKGTGSEVTVTGLTENTTYHFKVFEFNGGPSEEKFLRDTTASASSTTNFTPISVRSQSLVEATASSATFTAVVDRSSSLSTSYRVLWGTDSSSFTDSSSTIVKGTGASTDTVSYEITGLSENTLYYAQLRAITSQENVLSDAISIFFNNTIIPSDSLTLWLNADMSLSEAADAETLSVWYDLSGKANNGTQDNSSYKPVMATNQINGLPAVSFNGNSYFSLPNAQELGVVNKDYEIIVVASSGSSQRSLLFGNNYVSVFAPNMWLNYDQGFLFNGNSNHGYDFSVGESGEYTNGEYHVFNVSGTDTEGRIRIDNVPKGLDESESYRNSINGNWFVGASVRSDGFISDEFNGEVAEIIVYNKKLSSQERFDVHEYLSNKYNLELPLGTPDQQVSNLKFETSGATSATINYTRGNGAYNLAVVKAGSPVDATPTDSTTYTASSVFGSGTEIGTGNFVVYAGLDSSITISGLTQGTTYHATVYSFNGDQGLEKYLTTNADTVSLFVPITVNVSQLSPTPLSLNNAEGTEIKITFDKAMNTLSFGADSSFIVTGSEGGVYTGTFQFSDGNKVAEFTADSAFKAGETITVNITNKLVGASNPFKDPRTFSFHIETAISSATFEQSSVLVQGFGALRTHISDLNGDGKGDIYMVDSSGELHVRLNNGNGSYASKVQYSTDAEDPSFVAVDIEGDGDLDIILSNDDGSDIFILKNNGDGTFASATNIDFGSSSYSIEAADLDHDGNQDLIVGTDSILVSLNTDGSGSLSSRTSYLPGSTSYNIIDIAASDMDADGDVDIIALNNSTGFYLFKNNGDGMFQEAIELGQVDEPSSVSIGDLDDDGDADFVISSIDDYRIYVYKNNGDATFAARAQYETDDQMEHITLSDIDGDGDLDLIGKEESDSYIHLFLNPGDGTYPSYSSLNVNSNVRSFSASDFDNDNDVDLFVATYDSLYIYENISFDPLTISGSEGWRLITSPSGRKQYGNILTDLWTQGAIGADTEEGTPNVYYWPSTATSVSDTNWTPVTNLSDSLKSGQGMLMYVFSDDNGPEEGDTGFPKEIVFPGAEPTNTQYLSSLLNTNDDGWTLLGNPFYQQIDWDEFSRNDMSNSVYVYDDSAAAWKSWNGDSGSLTDGIIDVYDAFFVQSASDDPSLYINYPGGNQGGGAKAISKKNPHYFSLELSSESGLKNNAWFQFSEDGKFGIDASDAYQLSPLSNKYVTLASMLNDTTHLDINSLPDGEALYEIHLSVENFGSGAEHKISMDNLNLPEGWSVSLHDVVLGVSTNLEEAYTFRLDPVKAKSVNRRNMTTPASIMDMAGIGKNKQTVSRFTLTITASYTVGSERDNDLPEVVELQQNYPNPFNPTTKIAYGIPEAGEVTLEIFDMLGRKVATLISKENKPAGRYSVQFDAGNLASGLYLYRLKAGKKAVITKKLTLIK